jgi:hypothetical protein
MSKRTRSRRYFLIQHLVGHAMMGSVLGLIGAGLLLLIHASAIQSLFAGLPFWLSKILFLLCAGAYVGIGAAATGAILLLAEESMD